MSQRTLAIALFLAILLQLSIVDYVGIGSFQPDLPLLMVIVIGMRRGAFEGVISGFLAGILVDSVGSSFFGLSSFTYSVVGFMTGKGFYTEQRVPLGRWAYGSAAGILLGAVTYSYIYTLGEAPPWGAILLRHALPMSLYTWLVGMIWAISPFRRRQREVSAR